MDLDFGQLVSVSIGVILGSLALAVFKAIVGVQTDAQLTQVVSDAIDPQT